MTTTDQPQLPTPHPPTTGAEVEPAPEVLDGELLTDRDYTQQPPPVVLRSRRTAPATLRWAAH